MTRLRKELFGLAPLWAVALLLGLLPCVLPRFDDVRTVWLGAYAIGCVLLSTAVFGKEIAGGTLGLLLVQPIGRMRLLTEKAALALIASILLGAVCGLQFLLRAVEPPNLTFVPVCALLVPLCCVGPGVFFTLCLRQTVGAFWLTLLVPALLMTILDVVRGALGMPKEIDATSMIVILGLYGVAGAWLARRYFLRLQDCESPTLTLSIGFDRRATSSSRARTAPTRTATRALIKKELALQTLNFALAFALLCFYGLLALVGDRLILPGTNVAIGKDLILVCWILLPFSIGALPIAWERRLGILEWQQVQPVSRFRQWLIKAGVAYALSFLAAVVMIALFRVATLYSIGGELELGAYSVFILATTIGLCASSRSSSYLMALSLVLALVVALVALLFLGNSWLGYLPPVTAIPILTLVGFLCWLPVLCWLSWKNYAAIRVDRSINRLNICVSLCAVVAWFVSGYFLYNRVWERWIWSEPAAAPSIAVEGVNPSIRVGGAVLAPNGSLLWIMNERWSFVPIAHFTNSSPWIQVAGFGGLNLALAKDGVLWAVKGGWWADGNRVQREQILTEHRWSRIALGGVRRGTKEEILRFSGIDTDGNVWDGNLDPNTELSDLKLERPELPADLRWKDVALWGNVSLALAEDGTCCIWGEKKDLYLPTPTPLRPGEKWKQFLSQNGGELSIERQDGSLWVIISRYDNGQELPLALAGERHRWQTIAFSPYDGRRIIGIRDDGTLWESRNLPYDYTWVGDGRDHLAEQYFHRLSGRSDWVAISRFGQSTLALTADGKLWVWGSPSVQSEHGGLLPFSRIPKPIASLK